MSIEEQFAELRERLKKVEENQQAIDGAIRAFITVFAVRRLPEDPGGLESEHQ